MGYVLFKMERTLIAEGNATFPKEMEVLFNPSGCYISFGNVCRIGDNTCFTQEKMVEWSDPAEGNLIGEI